MFQLLGCLEVDRKLDSIRMDSVPVVFLVYLSWNPPMTLIKNQWWFTDG